MTFKLRSGGEIARSPSNSDGSFAVVHAWPRFLGILLLASLLMQGTLIQSHLHFAGSFGSTSVTSSEQSIASPTPAQGDPAAGCLLCHEAAMAGAFLLPEATALPPPPATIQWLFIAPITAFELPSPAFGWLSRAPPR
jgi:hypothetical protein